MLTAPYSIYVKKRPLRVAFLIEDKPESMATIDAIFAYNRERWGGRYNPIIITDGQTLTDAWWSFLEAVDPDVVASFAMLGDDLIDNIERRISPYLIQQPNTCDEEGRHPRIHLPHDGLTILPTSHNIRMANQSFRESSLVLFNTDRETDPLTKQFTDWNFGECSDPDFAVSRALEGVRTRDYPVTDMPSLLTPLTELSTFGSFTYPIQLCSVPNDALPPVQHDRFDEAFHVVVGDAPIDVAYFWNHPATTPQWNRHNLNQVWLPVSVATAPQLTTALSSWLQRMADPNGSYKGSIRFVSLSLSQEQLQEVVEPLFCKIRIPREVNALSEFQPPKINGFAGPLNHDKMDLYRAAGTTERFTLQEPDLPVAHTLGEHWMADLYIEFRPERYPSVHGLPLWWQLPRLNCLASWMFKRDSRILRTRFPSVLMKRGEPRLDITLLDDITVFAMLAAQPNQLRCTPNNRNSSASLGRAPYYHAQRSEKGRYLSGLLDLFGGLHTATGTLEQRYWRGMFDLLSGRTAHTDEKKQEEVGNRLRKRIGGNSSKFYEDDKSIKWLSSYVLNVARSLPALSRDLQFRDFEEQAKQEMEQFNRQRDGRKPIEYSKSDLMDALSRLTELGVLLMGIRSRCPSCGYRAWCHIDDAKQTLRCGGCNAAAPTPPELHWYYRLNNLARAAHAEHGLLPVVLVLGQLFMDSRSSFMFAPCLDLFEKDDERQVGDLDIAVILDGRFVIGEVKQSRDLFDEAAFAKMECVARRLLPDCLLFASMEQEPNALIIREIERLSEVLGPLGIKVQWYRLHKHKFDPSPVI